MKAMIFAAGLGTRLKPLTENTPKALVKIHGQPMLEWLIHRLITSGFDDLIINVHHFTQQIIDFVDVNNSFGINITFSREEMLLDTGGGLKYASWFFEDNQPFLLHNIDILSDIDLSEMLQYHKENNADVTLAVRMRKTSRYLLFDENLSLVGWQSVPDNKFLWAETRVSPITQLSFCGIHIISPKILQNLPPANKYPILPEYLRLVKMGFHIKAFNTDSYNWMDLGRTEQLKSIDRIFPESYFTPPKQERK